jgi:hypothetical protein
MLPTVGVSITVPALGSRWRMRTSMLTRRMRLSSVLRVEAASQAGTLAGAKAYQPSPPPITATATANFSAPMRLLRLVRACHALTACSSASMRACAPATMRARSTAVAKAGSAATWARRASKRSLSSGPSVASHASVATGEAGTVPTTGVSTRAMSRVSASIRASL